MGSFNTTCAVSNAPIREGDKVRLFFLVSDRFFYKRDPRRDSISKGCQCYSHDDFKVIGGISLEATYSDYNTYEFDHDTIFAKYIRSHILNNYEMNVSEEGKEYNPYHDHMDVPKSELDWEKIQDMIHSGRLFLKGYGTESTLPFVSTMAIHESVYQVMMNESYEAYIGYPDGLDYNSDFRPYETRTYASSLEKELEKEKQSGSEEELQKMIKHFYEYFDYTEMIKEGTITEEKALYDATRMAKRKLDGACENKLEYAYCSFHPLYELREITKLATFDENDLALEEKTKVYFKEFTDEDLVTKIFEGRFFDGRMETHNFMYRPIMTSGQEHDLTADGIFWQKVGNALLTLNSVWEEEEHVLTEKHSKAWQSVNLSDLVSTFTQWFNDPEDKDLVEFMKKVDAFKEEHLYIDVKEFGPEQFADPELEFLTNMIFNKSLNLELNIKK